MKVEDYRQPFHFLDTTDHSRISLCPDLVLNSPEIHKESHLEGPTVACADPHGRLQLVQSVLQLGVDGHENGGRFRRAAGEVQEDTRLLPAVDERRETGEDLAEPVPNPLRATHWAKLLESEVRGIFVEPGQLVRNPESRLAERVVALLRLTIARLVETRGYGGLDGLARLPVGCAGPGVWRDCSTCFDSHKAVYSKAPDATCRQDPYYLKATAHPRGGTFEVKISWWSYFKVRAKSNDQYTRFWETAAPLRCAGSRIAVVLDVNLELISPRLVERRKLRTLLGFRTHWCSILEAMTVNIVNFPGPVRGTSEGGIVGRGTHLEICHFRKCGWPHPCS